MHTWLRTLATTSLALLLALPAGAGPIEDRLDAFLADARATGPRAPGTEAEVLGWADLRTGELHDGTGIVSREAQVGLLGRGLRSLYLTRPEQSRVGLFPAAPASSGTVTLEVLAASNRPRSRFDVLVDHEVVVRDVAVPEGGFEPIAVDLTEELPLGPRRVEVRLAPGASPFAVLGLKIQATPSGLPQAATSSVRRVFQDHLGREPTVGELVAAAPHASEDASVEGNFLSRMLRDLKGALFKHGPLTREEALHFNFDKGRVTKRLKQRFEKTPPEILGVLAQRARIVIDQSTSWRAVKLADKVLAALQEQGVPLDPPPPPEPIHTPPQLPPDEVGGWPPQVPPPAPPMPPPPGPPSDPPAPPAPPPPADPPPAPPPADPPPSDPPPPPPPPPAEPPPAEPPPAEPPPAEPPPAEPPPEPPPSDPPPGDEPVDPNAIPIRRYYPLDVGRTWDYTDPTKNENFTVKVVEHTQFGGFAVARLRRMDKQVEADLPTLEGALKLVVRMDDEKGELSWADDPVPFAQGETVALGDKYEAIPKSYKNPLTGGFFHWKIQIKKLRDMTVPYGTVKDCIEIRVQNTDTVSGAKISDFTMYMGRGIGLVQRRGIFIGSPFDQQLKAFAGP